MVLLRLLLIIPAAIVGTLLGFMFLGLLPMIALDAVGVLDLHHSISREFVMWGARTGALLASVLVICWSIYERKRP